MRCATFVPRGCSFDSFRIGLRNAGLYAVVISAAETTVKPNPSGGNKGLTSRAEISGKQDN